MKVDITPQKKDENWFKRTPKSTETEYCKCHAAWMNQDCDRVLSVRESKI